MWKKILVTAVTWAWRMSMRTGRGLGSLTKVVTKGKFGKWALRALEIGGIGYWIHDWFKTGSNDFHVFDIPPSIKKALILDHYDDELVDAFVFSGVRLSSSGSSGSLPILYIYAAKYMSEQTGYMSRAYDDDALVSNLKQHRDVLGDLGLVDMEGDFSITADDLKELSEVAIKYLDFVVYMTVHLSDEEQSNKKGGRKS